MNTRRVLFGAVLCAGLMLIACLGAGEALSRPASHPIGDPPPGLHALPVRFSTAGREPVAGMPSLHAPVLVMSGTLDQHTTLAESRRIFEAAAAPKEFWAVEGAAHVDLFTYAPLAYASRVLPFLARHLHPPKQTP